MIFSVKDSLRQAVEAASGGLATVMYTKKGQPVFLRRIPRFNLEDIDPSLGTGPHPAFVVGDRVVSEVWIGMYPGTISQGELVSVPGVAPTPLSLAQAETAAQNNGPGFHLFSNAEYSAVAMLHWKANNGQEVLRGNTGWGQSHLVPWEAGVRVDGNAPGVAQNFWGAFVVNGSGPVTWRHDATPTGIYGLVGSWEFVGGLRLVNGEVQLTPQNDYAIGSRMWVAITPEGISVPPGSAGTLKLDIPLNANYNSDGAAQNLGTPVLRTTTKTPPSGWDAREDYEDYASGPATNITAESGVNIPAALRIYCILPPPNVTPRGHVFVVPYSTRYAQRGGFPSSNDGGGLMALQFAATYALGSIGLGTARPAFVL